MASGRERAEFLFAVLTGYLLGPFVEFVEAIGNSESNNQEIITVEILEATKADLQFFPSCEKVCHFTSVISQLLDNMGDSVKHQSMIDP